MAGPPTVGMVGAGQLARMTAQAAISLDVRVRVLADAEESPAAASGAIVERRPVTAGDLAELAARCDVVTFDHEGVDLAAVEALEASGRTVRPSSGALHLAVDKAEQRRRLGAAGFPVPPFCVTDQPAAVRGFVEVHGPAVVAKAATGGYDGRGVWFTDGADEALEALRVCGRLVLEPRLALDRELAVLVARRPGGEVVAYPVVETLQRDGICTEVVAPAPVPASVAAEARDLACAIAEHIGSTGILAVELFVVEGALLVNELATRPHNSGHLTIEGTTTSQFENHLRAVLDWPLGAVDLRAPAVAMANLIAVSEADLHERVPTALALGPVHVHLYGKRPRPGRKVGHVTVLGERPAEVVDLARRAAAVIVGSSPTGSQEGP
jgi:5-(carboxyamino)imidazole ribonucleotide synthase